MDSHDAVAIVRDSDRAPDITKKSEVAASAASAERVHDSNRAPDKTKKSEAAASVASADKVRAEAASLLMTEYPWLSKVAMKKMIDGLATGIAQQESAMDAAKARMNIFKLSPEIRNTIWEMVFSDHMSTNGDNKGRIVVQDMDLSHHAWATLKGKDYEYTAPHLNAPNLLETPNLQIREETQAFFYGSTTFYARVSQSHCVTGISEWLAHLGPSRCAMIKSFVIDLYNTDLEAVLRIPISTTRIGYTRIATGPPTHPNFLTPAADTAKLYTTVSHIVKRLELAGYGVAASAFTIKCRSGFGTVGNIGKEGWFDEEPEDQEVILVSPTALYCPVCKLSNEPDAQKFLGGVCNSCSERKAKNAEIDQADFYYGTLGYGHYGTLPYSDYGTSGYGHYGYSGCGHYGYSGYGHYGTSGYGLSNGSSYHNG